MTKNNFLLVDLHESKTKKLAETITSDTSRKILNYLIEKEDTETNIAKELQLPISTAHYHLQKLQEAGLVKVEEFHYSPKGREVNHYKLANKYIIIAPGNVAGLKEKLKGILPALIAAAGISVIIKFVTGIMAPPNFEAWRSSAALPMEKTDLFLAVPELSPQPDIAFWFFIGSIVSLGLYLLIQIVRESWKR